MIVWKDKNKWKEAGDDPLKIGARDRDDKW